MSTILIATAKANTILIQGLQNSGHHVLYEPQSTYLSIQQFMSEIDGLIIATQISIDKSILAKAKRLKWIGVLASGIDHVDVVEANKLGIDMIRCVGGNACAVAEHCLGQLLCLQKKIIQSFIEVKNKVWNREENKGIELSHKNIGIIGYGHIGTAFARLLKGFDVQVWVYDKYKTGFSHDYIRETTMAHLQEISDVISIHVPLTIETKAMCNVAFFHSLKRNPIFINSSRGSIVEAEALIDALQNKRIRGVALDVWENEQPSTLYDEEKKRFEWIVQQSNVILTPHIAGSTEESQERLSTLLLEKINHLAVGT